MAIEPEETPQQRRARYLRQAAEADYEASRAQGTASEQFFRAIATSWRRLAEYVLAEDGE